MNHSVAAFTTSALNTRMFRPVFRHWPLPRIGWVACATLTLLGTNSCANLEDKGESMKLGAATGGVVGAIIGHQSNRSGEGALLGSVFGAGAGAAVSAGYKGGLENKRDQNEAAQRSNLQGSMTRRE